MHERKASRHGGVAVTWKKNSTALVGVPMQRKEKQGKKKITYQI
jgi:hypothetical protein